MECTPIGKGCTVKPPDPATEGHIINGSIPLGRFAGISVGAHWSAGLIAVVAVDHPPGAECDLGLDVQSCAEQLAVVIAGDDGVPGDAGLVEPGRQAVEHGLAAAVLEEVAGDDEAVQVEAR